MLTPKSLTFEMDTGGLSINDVASLHYNMFVAKNYDWWYEVLPDDVVVDIGASIGSFSARALDAGAKKVYMIEPNRELLKTAVKNVSDYIIDQEETRVIPINAAMGKTDVDLSNVYKINGREQEQEPRLMSLRQFIDTYNLSKIDFLKINAAGAEFSILDPDNLNFITNHIRHIAMVVHLDGQYGSKEKFKVWRQRLLRPMIELNRARFQDESFAQKIFWDNCFEVLPKSFMVYITNW